jgi:hypothetical protein
MEKAKIVITTSAALIEWIATNAVLGFAYTFAYIQHFPHVEIFGTLAVVVLMVYNIYSIKLTIAETKGRRLDNERKQIELEEKLEKIEKIKIEKEKLINDLSQKKDDQIKYP